METKMENANKTVPIVRSFFMLNHIIIPEKAHIIIKIERESAKKTQSHFIEKLYTTCCGQ